MQEETLKLLSDKIEERRKEMLESLGDGTADNFGAYQHACGVIRGYLIVQSLIAEGLRSLKEEDEYECNHSSSTYYR